MSAKDEPSKTGKRQINPSIPEEFDRQLDELGDIYDVPKLHAANVALQYGIRHYKLANDEYQELRKRLYRDADDESSMDGSNVVQLASSRSVET
jgi:hypothetical protein